MECGPISVWEGQSHIERIEVNWLGGETEIFTDLEVDQSITIVEGTSQTTQKPLETTSSSLPTGTNGSE